MWGRSVFSGGAGWTKDNDKDYNYRPKHAESTYTVQPLYRHLQHSSACKYKKLCSWCW